jgi:hypothetical protein
MIPKAWGGFRKRSCSNKSGSVIAPKAERDDARRESVALSPVATTVLAILTQGRNEMKPIKPAAAALAFVLAASAAVPAAAQNYPVVCAQRDVQLVTQLEQAGEAQSLPGEILYEAFRVLTRARKACSQGRVTVGLALYDTIFKTSLAGQIGTSN